VGSRRLQIKLGHKNERKQLRDDLNTDLSIEFSASAIEKRWQNTTGLRQGPPMADHTASTSRLARTQNTPVLPPHTAAEFNERR
jgi:hypothetical protein